MRHGRATALIAAAVLIALVAFPATGSEVRTYQVTVTNLTSGQPMTPVLAATHKGSNGMFTVGREASHQLREIAENGNLGPMVDRVSSDDDFFDHVVEFGASVPPVLPGETVTFSIQAAPPFNFLSWASMLICTNDGFTGVDGVKMPSRVGKSVTLHTQGYDAGSEINTELFADIVPPCGPLTGQDNMGHGAGTSNPALAEGGVIHHHAGILGVGDLDPAINDWTNPVGRITITRTN